MSYARVAAALGLTFALMGAAQAAPVQTAQAPGFHRMALGDFVVTALYDGYVDLDPKVLTGASPQDVQRLLADMFAQRAGGMQTAVNGYLVHTGAQLVLIDTGSGHCFGPTLGQLDSNLQAAGYTPADVDAVLLTHLHPDHACGLVTPQGQARFPRAKVYAAREEAAYWLSNTIASAAPEAARPMFAMAAQAVAPYQESGRFIAYDGDPGIMPGLSIVESPGHTPGHRSYRLSSGGQTLLIWGDIVHNHAVQLPRPEIAIEFDVESGQAVATRRQILAEAARERLWIGGAHLPFPGLGHVRPDGAGYVWVPLEYAPLRNK